MIDDTELDTPPDEPSREDFEAAEREAKERVGRASRVARILRLVGVMFVIVALVAYLVVPVRVFIQQAAGNLLGPNGPIHVVPLAPKPAVPPTIRT